jgi:hypothetical protein
MGRHRGNKAACRKAQKIKCPYCRKYQSRILCAAGKPLFEAYRAALHWYYQVSVVRGKRERDPEYFDSWLALSLSEHAYDAHRYRRR